MGRQRLNSRCDHKECKGKRGRENHTNFAIAQVMNNRMEYKYILTITDIVEAHCYVVTTGK